MLWNTNRNLEHRREGKYEKAKKKKSQESLFNLGLVSKSSWGDEGESERQSSDAQTLLLLSLSEEEEKAKDSAGADEQRFISTSTDQGKDRLPSCLITDYFRKQIYIYVMVPCPPSHMGIWENALMH